MTLKKIMFYQLFLPGQTAEERIHIAEELQQVKHILSTFGTLLFCFLINKSNFMSYFRGYIDGWRLSTSSGK